MRTLKTLGLCLVTSTIAFAISGCATAQPATQVDIQSATNPVVQVEPFESERSEAAVEVDVPITYVMQVGDTDATTVDQNALSNAVADMTAGNLSDVDREGILYMIEEEKLARDVYLAMDQMWDTPIFGNIAGSEQTHMDAVATLVENYGLEAPHTLTTPGLFVDAELQALYDQLITAGSVSLVEAIKVGAAIEEIDIIDLQDYLAETSQEDIRLVYENLFKGSRNHLRAFASNYERQTGEVYEPQYLDRDVYESIIAGDTETGGQGQGGRGWSGKGRGRQG